MADHRALPHLGEWNGIIYGELGKLASEDDRLQCHCCGGWYENLGSHVRLKHAVAVDEYRVIFGLKATTGLFGARLMEIHRQKAKKHLAAIGREVLEENRRTGKQPKGRPIGMKVRLEEQRERDEPTRRASVARKITATLRQLYAEGKIDSGRRGGKAWARQLAADPDLKERVMQRMKETQSDPEWRARWLEKYAQGELRAREKRALLPRDEQGRYTRRTVNNHLAQPSNVLEAANSKPE